MFFNKSQKNSITDLSGFDYLDQEKSFYFDSACQTLRPIEVIKAEQDYYKNYNACGHRVKYEWGKQVDKKVEETRNLILTLLGKSSSLYTVAFCLNTTHGINTVLHQLNPLKFDRVITSDIEHNSVFLNSITWAKRNNKDRIVWTRNSDGSMDYDSNQLKKSIVLVNTTSNIDGRNLTNLKILSEDVHKVDGLLLLDCAQTLGHDLGILKDVDFDAVFASGHKMYGQSIGFIVIKKALIRELDCYLIGGGTVEDVSFNNYELVSNENELYSRIESGLQNYAGIIGLGEAIKWKNSLRINGMTPLQYEIDLSKYLFNKLTEIPQLNIINNSSSPVVSVYSDKLDSHQLGAFLGVKQIMCRTGYFCCHYYLKEVRHLPPLLRISLGLNNSKEQIDFLVENLKFVLEKF